MHTFHRPTTWAGETGAKSKLSFRNGSIAKWSSPKDLITVERMDEEVRLKVYERGLAAVSGIQASA